MGSLTYVILNAYKIFGYPAAGDSVQKCLMVAVLLGLSLAFGAQPVFIAVGFLAGAGAKVLIHLIGLRHKLSFIRPRLNLDSPDMRRFLMLLAPLLVGIVGAKVRDIITKGTFGSYLPAGQLSAIDWAKRVLDAVASSRGSAVALDGQMIDGPLILMAERILCDAEER